MMVPDQGLPSPRDSTSTPSTHGNTDMRTPPDVHEPIDPHVGPSSTSGSEELDESLDHQLENFMLHEKRDPSESSSFNVGDAEKRMAASEVIYVEFDAGDARNPINFPWKKKWIITAMACLFTTFSGSVASEYNMGFPSMTVDLNCSRFEATIGLSVFALGFGVVPLFSASFSEEFGRRPLYIGSAIGFVLMYMMVALAKNIQTVILARLMQGAFGSTGATMVGGTIADIWAPHERGLPMSLFAVAALGGTGMGPVAAGWIEMNPHLEWRWIQWIQMIIFSGYLVLVPFFLVETRSSILLTQFAKKIRKETGDHRYRARVEDERASLRTLIYISCTRPVYLLLTEPIVTSFSLWIGFAWGVTYCLIESIPGVFRTLHNFSVGEIGSAFGAIMVGSLFGFCSNLYQETLYQKYFPNRGPEARLYSACAAALFLPIGMFIYAWSSFTFVHWIAQVIGITVYIWGTYVVYLAVFSYLADCYGPFASSALAGQSLARNLAAMAFPLFTQQMFDKLTYKWANTIFGLIAVVMIPIPFVLFFHGPAIRKKSKFSRMVMENQK